MVPDSNHGIQLPPAETRFSLAESLEQLAVASENLANLLKAALGEESDAQKPKPRNATDLEEAKQTLAGIFDGRAIEGFDGSEEMERARLAHLNAAIEMYKILSESDESTFPLENIHNSYDLASAIGQSLLKELTEFYQNAKRGNDRTVFTTEQRTALESAFLLKPKLNTAEKRALAKACNLNPRQVEVWVGVHSPERSS
jgi:hypothetical protein